MSFHLVLGLLVLTVASVTDIKERRIPNRLLAVACLLHLLVAIIAERLIVDWFPFLLYVTIIAALLSGRRFRSVLITSIGMGDLKLIGYLFLFVMPHVDLLHWFIGLSIASTVTIAVLYLRGRERKSIPFAPLILLGTIGSLS